MILAENVAQGTPEWLRLRLGVVTASGVSKILNFGHKSGWRHAGCDTWHSSADVAERCKKGDGHAYKDSQLTASLSAQRTAYRNQLLAEWATGEPVDAFAGTVWTERGNLFEGPAADFFRFETGMDVTACGFAYRDESKTCGASPDGLVLGDGGEIIGGLEIKCPRLDTHFGYILDGRDKYEEQVQFSLWVTGLPCWWFLSYFPGMPPVLERILPADEYQAAFDEHIPQFLLELDESKQRLIAAGVSAP